jgi:hypothetical protein
MDENRIVGSAKEIKGEAKEGIGKASARQLAMQNCKPTERWIKPKAKCRTPSAESMTLCRML